MDVVVDVDLNLSRERANELSTVSPPLPTASVDVVVDVDVDGALKREQGVSNRAHPPDPDPTGRSALTLSCPAMRVADVEELVHDHDHDDDHVHVYVKVPAPS